MNPSATQFRKTITITFILLISVVSAQQDLQYTQYMYNTMSVNAAYAGQRKALSFSGQYRTQWVGVDGAAETISFGVHSPLKKEAIGLGLVILSDKLGPATESSISINTSYTIPFNSKADLSFGLKAGIQLLDTDWSKVTRKDNTQFFNENVNIIYLLVGAGLYLHSDNWYVGFSVPNFSQAKHYDYTQDAIASERLHYFLIGGYVFQINNKLKLKPAALLKAVSGAPIIPDLSVNALINNMLTLGASYRFDDSVSGLAGFQLNDNIFLGYSYDYTVSDLQDTNSGTHEVVVRVELFLEKMFVSPRFF